MTVFGDIQSYVTKEARLQKCGNVVAQKKDAEPAQQTHCCTHLSPMCFPDHLLHMLRDTAIYSRIVGRAKKD